MNLLGHRGWYEFTGTYSPPVSLRRSFAKRRVVFYHIPRCLSNLLYLVIFFNNTRQPGKSFARFARAALALQPRRPTVQHALAGGQRRGLQALTGAAVTLADVSHFASRSAHSPCHYEGESTVSNQPSCAPVS
jgi:hypothetical protein